MTFSRFLDLLAFMLPAYAANMAPPFLRFWDGTRRSTGNTSAPTRPSLASLWG
jgi:hypothetical protein